MSHSKGVIRICGSASAAVLALGPSVQKFDFKILTLNISSGMKRKFSKTSFQALLYYDLLFFNIHIDKPL